MFELSVTRRATMLTPGRDAEIVRVAGADQAGDGVPCCEAVAMGSAVLSAKS